MHKALWIVSRGFSKCGKSNLVIKRTELKRWWVEFLLRLSLGLIILKPNGIPGGYSQDGATEHLGAHGEYVTVTVQPEEYSACLVQPAG